jgi:hypothetical protein
LNSLLKYLGTCSIVVLLLVYGFASGIRFDRWSNNGSLSEASARIADLPTTLPKWTSEPVEIDLGEVLTGGIEGFSLRRFRNSLTGDTVQLFLVCGHSGPVSVHNPEVCYKGAGFEVTQERDKLEIPGAIPSQSAGNFWRIELAKGDSPIPQKLILYYGWNGRGAWVAPANTRLGFGRLPFLYKMYVILDSNSARSTAELETSAKDLLADLLPRYNEVLYPLLPTHPLTNP